MLKIQEKLAKKYRYKPLPKDLSKKYREFFADNIPEELKPYIDSKPKPSIYTVNNTVIATSFEKIVIGDYGAFIEFDFLQANDEAFVIKPGQEYRINDPKYSKSIKYEWWTINDGSNIKIYKQVRKVDYADYKPGMYYVSVHEAII